MSSRLVTQISLSFTPWRARGQHGAPPIAEGRYYLGACARAASRTSSLADCCAIAVASKNCAARHTSGTRRVSRRRPIGKLPPGRDGPATQTWRRELVRDCPARPTRERFEAQKAQRWVIIIMFVGSRAAITRNTSIPTNLVNSPARGDFTRFR